MSFVLTDEQNAIINEIKNENNVKINAVAGAGKSTTLLYMSEELIKNGAAKVTIVTYNKFLQIGLQEKIREHNLENVKAYTFHALAGKYFGKIINTDELFWELYKNNAPIVSEDVEKVLLIDECQDLTDYYYWFIRKITNENTLMAIVGDKRQYINEYKGAQLCYFLEPQKYFPSNRRWVELTLTKTFRLSGPICNFVNKCILEKELLECGNEGLKKRTMNTPKPSYVYNVPENEKCNVADYGEDFELRLRSDIKTYGKTDRRNICITMKSIKDEDNTFGKVTTRLNEMKISWWKKGKIGKDQPNKTDVIISTFASLKGKEFDVVYVMGFDESYYENMEGTFEKFPNIIYVATTRAKKKLVLFEGNGTTFRNLNPDDIKTYCDPTRPNKRKIEPIPLNTRRHLQIKNVTEYKHPKYFDDLMELLIVEKCKGEIVEDIPTQYYKYYDYYKKLLLLTIKNKGSIDDNWNYQNELVKIVKNQHQNEDEADYIIQNLNAENFENFVDFKNFEAFVDFEKKYSSYYNNTTLNGIADFETKDMVYIISPISNISICECAALIWLTSLKNKGCVYDFLTREKVYIELEPTKKTEFISKFLEPIRPVYYEQDILFKKDGDGIFTDSLEDTIG